MSFRQFIAGLIRGFVLNEITEAVISDIATNGLTADDHTVIDSYLDTAMP